MVDWIKIVIVIVLIYIAFLVFSQVTRFIFRLALVALIIGILAFGFVDFGELTGLAKDNLESNLDEMVLSNNEVNNEINLTADANFSKVNVTNSTG